MFDGPVAFNTFKKGKPTSGQEILSLGQWSFEIDYIGIADIMHLLLFGEPLKLKKEDDLWRTNKNFKPSWHPVWQEAFTQLLNTQYSSHMDGFLTKLRKRLEEASIVKLHMVDISRIVRQIRITFFMNRKNLQTSR